jgi:hypothetical protein
VPQNKFNGRDKYAPVDDIRRNPLRGPQKPNGFRRMSWSCTPKFTRVLETRCPMAIKDRGQVRAAWQWARDLDCDNLLWREFCRPIEVETGSKEDLAIQLTEGWILGCSPTVTNQ